jgi:hypothetical protein
MSVTCPSGHLSATSDYCDQCGVRIEAPLAAAELAADAGVEVPRDSIPIPTSTSTAATPCPVCGVLRPGNDRYCEECGYDFVAGVPPSPAPDAARDGDGGGAGGDADRVGTDAPPPVWTVIVEADRAYFERLAPDDVEFPSASSPRTVTLDGAELRIGRGGASGSADVEVDIVGADADPAVSRLHAVLVRQLDGSYAIVDTGSANGTTLNGSAREIGANEPVLLRDGDRIHIGAWTTITVRRSDGGR